MASKSAGPLLVAGALTWTNQVILTDEKPDAEEIFHHTVRIGVATGLLTGAFYGVEKISPEFAVGMAWISLVTTLIVRYKNQPTVLERILKFFG